MVLSFFDSMLGDSMLWRQRLWLLLWYSLSSHSPTPPSSRHGVSWPCSDLHFGLVKCRSLKCSFELGRALLLYVLQE